MFAYLSKKISMPNNTMLNVVGWNQEKGYLAAGGDQGLLKVLKLESGKGQGGGNLSMNQNLQGHQGNVVVIQWNDQYQKLTTSDEQGLIIVWMMHKSHWFEEMINNRNKSVVTDMRWTPNGEKIGIVYEDGAVIVGSVEGTRLWGKELKIRLKIIEWSPDSRTILFGTPEGAVNVYDYVGNFQFPVKINCLRGLQGQEMPLAAIEWYDSNRQGFSYEDQDENAAQLCVAYQCGRMQMMKTLTDDDPVLVDTGMFVKSVKWNPNGNVLAVAGSLIDGPEGNKGIVQFYSPFGQHLRSLRVPSYTGMVNAVSWEGFGLRVALAVDTNILFSNIQPDYMWGYFSQTLVFAFRKPERNDMCIIFWDVSINEKHIKYMKRLQKIVCSEEYCVLIAKLEETGQDQWILVLCNAVGCPIESKTITIEPKFVTMNKTHLIVASEEVVYYWQYRSNHSKLVTLEQQKKSKSGKENAFHIEEIPKADAIYDKSKWIKPDILTQDLISSIAAGPDSFIVGRMSGQVIKYSLPYIQLENKLMLRCRPQQLQMNCDSTKFSIIDINGILSFYDMLDTSEGNTGTGTHLPTERKEVWSLVWSSDNPQLCALMEKNRLFVLRDFEPEEPVLSAGYLCDFTDLEVKSCMLDDILKDPEEIKNIKSMFVEYEAKSLRDTRDLLTTVSLKDACDFVEKNSHRRLWQLVTEAALDKLNFNIAERAFVKNDDYYGVQLINRLQNLDEKVKQKAEVACYFKRYDEAEQIFKDIDRKDLALDLRMRLGDWARVIQLIEAGAGNDEMLKKAHKNLGDYSAERQKWAKAAKYFKLSHDFEALANAYYKLEDFTSLEKLLDSIPENSPILETLGEKFQSMGLCSAAVDSYVKFGDVKKAIDCCVLLNEWNLAVELAEQHNFLQIEQLLQKYAAHLIEKNKKMEAIELYRKANKNTDAARLLAEMAQELREKNAPLLLIKKIYVLAAFEVDSYKQRVFDAQVAQITGTGQTAAEVAAKTMNSLITSDISTSADKALTNPWKGAEAIHFFLLCQRQLYQKEYNRAMKTAMRLIEYEKELTTKEVYSIVAIACYFNSCFRECSKAFVKLERLEDMTKAEREKYENLAIQLFSRHPPVDKPNQEFKCPKRDCKAMISEFDINCRDCGSHFSPCMTSGASILAKEYYTCKTCKHKSLEAELLALRLRHCTLCHGKIDPQVLQNMGNNDALKNGQGKQPGTAKVPGAAAKKQRAV